MNIKSFKILSGIAFRLFLFFGSLSLIWFFILAPYHFLRQVFLSLILYQIISIMLILLVLIISVVTRSNIRTIQGKRTILRSILAILFTTGIVLGCYISYLFYDLRWVLSPSDNKIFFGENVTLGSGEELIGDLVVFGGNVTVEEEANLSGNLVVFGGTISSNGNLDGDVVIFGGQIALDENAVVAGDIVTIGGQVDQAEGAVIQGEVIMNISPDIQLPNGQIPPINVPSGASNNSVSEILLTITTLTALISAISGAIAQFAAHKKSLADIEIEKQRLALERDKFELEKSKSRPERKSKNRK